MRIYGIFGDPIEHSLSPAMQNAAFHELKMDACYLPFRVSRERLEDAIFGAAALGFCGLNLTIPLKEKALEIVQPDKLAKAIGAVNTVSFGEEIMGYNTDGFGALLALQEARVRVKGSQVLIIGAGGAARAIAYTLEQEGAEITIANRSPRRAEELARMVGGRGYGLEGLERLVPLADIVINATSIGMHEEDPRLFCGDLLRPGQAIFDIVYNWETKLLRDARAAGALGIDGVMMLVYQGAKAFEIWTGHKAPAKVMEKAVREGLKERAEKEARKGAGDANDAGGAGEAMGQGK